MNLRLLSAILAVTSISGLACSSSSSGGGSGGCVKGSPSTDPACNSCIESKCSAELTDAFGSGYASGNLAGGQCATYGSCVEKCGCGDTGCIAGCPAPDANCTTAISAVSTCEQQSCASACSSTGTGGSGGGGGTQSVSCNRPATNQCGIFDVLPSDVSGIKQQCAQEGGTIVDACPTANLDGCCTIGPLEYCYYNATGTQQQCEASGGTWSAAI